MSKSKQYDVLFVNILVAALGSCFACAIWIDTEEEDNAEMVSEEMDVR